LQQPAALLGAAPGVAGDASMEDWLRGCWAEAGGDRGGNPKTTCTDSGE